ncbi:FecCD family ABC transporter permease [Bordetella bronchialis]|uniref:Iron-siderophore ABC transporter permease n=1 Tax=Bordetella bronchialis TaxID=463025 RepID=A0ABM6CW64_9BORD|nr:iron ABC transporter permease [Bordetella bronchialis]ANN68385.1 iron-siderophore ABC transporter permease [Bordetella bronchialis]
MAGAAVPGPVQAYRRILRRRARVLAVLAALAAAALLGNLMVGASAMPPSHLLSTLLDPAGAPAVDRIIVWNVRLPYALAAIAVGTALGLAGAEMQTILNNPLASADTLGVSSAAALGASVAIALGGWLPAGLPAEWAVTACAFVFAMASALLLNGVARWGGMSASAVVLFGIALVFLCNAIVSAIQFAASATALQNVVFWTMGSLDRMSWSGLAALVAALAVAGFFSLRAAWPLTLLRLGEDRAASAGIDVRRLRLGAVARIGTLSALAVSMVGVIGFVGLVAPHIARRLFGEDHRPYLAGSALIGAVVLSLASLLSKVLVPGVLLPVGIVTAIVGLPVFLAVVLRRRLP